SKAGALAEANTYRFSSKDLHPNSGLCYYGFRFYDPNLQRWPNRDPLREPGFELLRRRKHTPALAFRTQVGSNGSNLYGFVRNQPLTSYDPLGLVEYGPGTEACKQAEEQAEAAWELYEAEPTDENLERAIVLSGIAAAYCAPRPKPPPPPKCPWWQ